MIDIRKLALCAVVSAASIANCVALCPQATSQIAQSPSIRVGIVLKKDHLHVGDRPIADVTVTNIGERSLCVSADGSRVHIAGEDGEPPKTEYYRHLLGDFRLGDGPGLASGPVACQNIAPRIENYDGMSTTFHFDLAAYYDLGVPGKYSVYIEFPDAADTQHGSEPLVSSPKVKLEMETQNQ
jgi:hypothetical protein